MFFKRPKQPVTIDSIIAPLDKMRADLEKLGADALQAATDALAAHARHKSNAERSAAIVGNLKALTWVNEKVAPAGKVA